MPSVQKSQKFFITGQLPWLFSVFTRLSLDGLAFLMVSMTSCMLMTNKCFSPAQTSFLSSRAMQLSFKSLWAASLSPPILLFLLCLPKCQHHPPGSSSQVAEHLPGPSGPCSLTSGGFQSLRILFPSCRFNTPTLSPPC